MGKSKDLTKELYSDKAIFLHVITQNTDIW